MDQQSIQWHPSGELRQRDLGEIHSGMASRSEQRRARAVARVIRPGGAAEVDDAWDRGFWKQFRPANVSPRRGGSASNSGSSPTPANAMNEDFRDLLLAFAEAKVRFLIVGAYALAVHGHPRATGDLDVWIDPTPANARRTYEALAAQDQG